MSSSRIKAPMIVPIKADLLRLVLLLRFPLGVEEVGEEVEDVVLEGSADEEVLGETVKGREEGVGSAVIL